MNKNAVQSEDPTERPSPAGRATWPESLESACAHLQTSPGCFCHDARFPQNVSANQGHARAPLATRLKAQWSGCRWSCTQRPKLGWSTCSLKGNSSADMLFPERHSKLPSLQAKPLLRQRHTSRFHRSLSISKMMPPGWHVWWLVSKSPYCLYFYNYS